MQLDEELRYLQRKRLVRELDSLRLKVSDPESHLPTSSADCMTR
jgi:hypothetical protein